MKQARVLKDIEIRKLFKVCELTRHKERNRLIVAFSFFCGLRAIEIANLRVRNVLSPTNDILDLIILDKDQTKGSNRQTVFVNKILKREIARFIAKFPNVIKEKDEFLFKTQKGNFQSQTIQNLFKGLYKLANIEQASSHSGRRTYITKLAENGVAVPIIQKCARHANLATTSRYISVSEDKIFNAVNSINV